MLKKFIGTGKEHMKKLRLNYRNSFGWTTDRKLIVIESDDWGSIRVSSKEAYRSMIRNGDRMDQDSFTRYDALESEEDLTFLFEVLSRHIDFRGNKPVITANCAMANPDFNRIRESNFERYYYEPFRETLKRYPRHAHSFELWKEGIEKNIFYPQLHCREHFQVFRWMKDLRAGERNVRLAFDHGMISGGNAFARDNPYAYMDAFNYYHEGSNELLQEIITDACVIFENAYGFNSKSFVACCYVWSDALEIAVKQNGVGIIQGNWHQFCPFNDHYGEYKKIRHRQGERNALGQIYLVRNCSFEPAICQDNATVQRCLQQINCAFQRQKPAVICSHRLNYIGFIDEQNRDKNLYLLDELLKEILKIWPDAEFITSVQLGELIT